MAPTVDTIGFFKFFFDEILAVSDDTIMWKVSPDTSPTTGASAFLNLHFQYFITELSTLKSPKKGPFSLLMANCVNLLRSFSVILSSSFSWKCH